MLLTREMLRDCWRNSSPEEKAATIADMKQQRAEDIAFEQQWERDEQARLNTPAPPGSPRKMTAAFISDEWVADQIDLLRKLMEKPVPKTGTPQAALDDVKIVYEAVRAATDLKRFTDHPYMSRFEGWTTKQFLEAEGWRLSSLNRLTDQYTPASNDGPIELVIKEAWRDHYNRNVKYVGDLFLTCPSIDKYGSDDKLASRVRAAAPPEVLESIRKGDLTPEVKGFFKKFDLRAKAVRLLAKSATYDPIKAVRSFYKELGEWVGRMQESYDVVREYHVGRVKIMILDLDAQPEHDKAVRAAIETTFRLTAQRGLKHLLYGNLFYLGNEGRKLTDEERKEARGVGYDPDMTAAGFYSPESDEIHIHDAPHKLKDILIHELGHRQFYKFMGSEQRARFNAWVQTRANPEETEDLPAGEADEQGQPKPVKPVSQYGGTNVAEAFAEVFMHYLTGKRLDSDQKESLLTIMKNAAPLSSPRKVALRVKLASRPVLPTLWYENEAGERWPVDLNDPTASPPEGFVYQWSRFPTILRETCNRTILQADVDACDHPGDMLKPDLGLIEGLEGRECMKCRGTQVKDAGAPWPVQWEAHGSRDVMSGDSSWPDDLVLAMVRPSPAEMCVALERHGEEPRLLGMQDAIILAASSCERCLNALLWRYGLDDGYPPYSEGWDKAGTSCDICKTPGVWNWLMNEKNVAYTKTAASQHYTKLCSVCGAVIEQCRCKSPNKVTLYGVCDACSGKPEPDRFDFSPEILARLKTVLLTDDELAARVTARCLEAAPSPHQRGWEHRKEKDERAQVNIPPEHQLAWKKLKNMFKGTPHERAEQFMEYLEEHPGESDEILQQNADRDVAKFQREHQKQVRQERNCDKGQTKYEDAWYKEQDRQTKEKQNLQQLKELADNVCQSCPTCTEYKGDEERVPFAASTRIESAMDDMPLAARIAARYKSKKKVKTESGDTATIYEYSEGQVARRNADKAKRLEGLRKNIGNLRAKVKRDLKSSDPEKALTALAVALIDHTYERVGNDTSAKERGHVGVTGWQKSHISFGRGKATVKYTGKSGVEQKKTVSDKAVLTALRNAYEACGDDEGCLFEHAQGKVGADKINAYLEAFDVSAKDLRGFHANDTMIQELHTERGKGGKLSEDKKERKTKLKEEFKSALERTAEIVGHEPSTLRSQYLVPGLEDQFVKDGTIIKSLTNKTAAERVLDRFLERK